MHLFEFAFYTAGALYAIFTEQVLIFYFLVVVGVYILVGNLLPGASELSIRKKIMSATWTPPSEGVAYLKNAVRVDKVLKLLETLPKENRPTLTHYAIKAIGRLLEECPEVNGKLVFGKVSLFDKFSSSSTKPKTSAAWSTSTAARTSPWSW